jgi:ABC-type uncharacterized transport system permease subunit
LNDSEIVKVQKVAAGSGRGYSGKSGESDGLPFPAAGWQGRSDKASRKTPQKLLLFTRRKSVMVVFLLILALAYFGGSYFAYNALRRKYAGIIGIPGSYFILLTAFLVIGLIRGIFTGGFGESALELVLTVVIMLAGIAYTVLMILRCETLADRILLPFAAILIGSGFCIRFVAAIAFHVPMESGKVESASFPASMRDSGGDIWELGNHNDVSAEYRCAKTGERREFGIGDFSGGRPFGFS